MPKDNIPFVAIIGGFWEFKYKNQTKFEDAKKMANSIGEELAKAGMGLVVYFSNDESLEPYVVSGFVAALPPEANKPLIRVRFSESQKNKVKFAEQETRRELFDPILFPGNDWEAPFYRSLVAADGVDAVLLMAGARSTLIAGQIALARPLPVLAIDHFDGAAGIIRSELASTDRDYPSSTTHNTKSLVAWLQDKCAKRAKQKEQAIERDKNYWKLISHKHKAFWVASAFIALLVTAYFGTTKAPDPAIWPFLMYIGLVSAGATGALVRSIMWGGDNSSPATSLLLGSIAGFAVGLAYLIPQFIGAPGILESSATAVGPTAKIQFLSALLVAIPAGVGFDTVFTRMQKQMEDQPITISSQQKLDK